MCQEEGGVFVLGVWGVYVVFRLANTLGLLTTLYSDRKRYDGIPIRPFLGIYHSHLELLPCVVAERQGPTSTELLGALASSAVVTLDASVPKLQLFHKQRTSSARPSLPFSSRPDHFGGQQENGGPRARSVTFSTEVPSISSAEKSQTSSAPGEH